MDDERLVTDLETAIADTGALLVQAQKYRRGTGPEGAGLLREALSLGDTARQLSRRHRLDAAAARDLLAAARALSGRVRAVCGAARIAPAYVEAVAAHSRGDRETLLRLLPEVFCGLEPVGTAPDLFVALTWRRRNRPRPAADIVAEVVRLRAEGIVAAGDDLSPGADPALPAVVLQDTVPADEPVVLRLAAGTLADSLLRLTETGDYLVHAPRLHTPFVVCLATALGPDAVESAPVDYARYRLEIAAALTAAGVAFVDR